MENQFQTATVSNLNECTEMAEAAGHPYLYFTTNNGCITYENCDTHRFATAGGTNYRYEGMSSIEQIMAVPCNSDLNLKLCIMRLLILHN